MAQKKRPALFRPIWVEAVILAIIIGLSLLVRTYRLTFPLADWHSFRQVDTASVTREFVKHGIDLLHPQYHDLSNIQSGKDNLAGWRMVEFPLVNGLIAGLLRFQPGWDLVIVSRISSIGASLISLVALYWLARRFYGRPVGLVAAAAFGLMPYSVYYSRTVLPEPFTVMFSLLAAAAVRLWTERQQDRWLVLAGFSFSLALLTKPMAIFFVPLLLGVWWRQRVWRVRPILKAILVGALAFLPLWWWRRWILQFPSGIAASDWLYNGNGIRLRPAWWRWIFADRLGRIMFGHWGGAILFLGIPAGCDPSFRWPATKNWLQWIREFLQTIDRYLQREGLLVLGSLGMLAYLVIFATGNVQHDYYQVLLVPILALLWARGAVWLVSVGRGWQRWCLAAVVGIVAGFSLIFAWSEVSGNFNVNNWSYRAAGQAVDRLTPADALVIAPGFGDTTLLFQTNRRGWPIGFEIPDKIAKGAQFYITTAQDDEANDLMRQYPVIEQTKDYILIDLRHPLPSVEKPVQ